MTMPGNDIVGDKFGAIQRQPNRSPETEGQIRIVEAWKAVQKNLDDLNELLAAIRLRGTHRDEAILWFAQKDPCGDRGRDMLELQKELGTSIEELRDAMFQVGKDMGLLKGRRADGGVRYEKGMDHGWNLKSVLKRNTIIVLHLLLLILLPTQREKQKVLDKSEFNIKHYWI